jgi:threonine/homoserine/homoserine lactone efflux protein
VVPGVGQVLICALFIGMGLSWLFFADALCDWQIRWLRSRRYRLSLRAMGALFAALGVVLAWTFWSGKLR